jgi:hypothetical protein
MIKQYRIVIGIVSAVLICGIAIVAVNASDVGAGISGLFFKAYDKTMSPGERYEKNITVRKYYNLTIRFQKETTSSSYLTFSDNSTVVVIKDPEGLERMRVVGVKSGKAYVMVTNDELASFATATALNVSDYADVGAQTVNSSCLTFSGTTAYLTIKVRYSSATMSGYVFDELTGEMMDGIGVAAFADGDNATSSMPISYGVTGDDGKYLLSLDLSDDKAFDVYVEGYEVS